MAGRIVIAEARCKGCQLCTTVCPRRLVSMAGRFNALGYHPSQFQDTDRQCTGCMLCALICPEAAITVYRSESKRAMQYAQPAGAPISKA
jgi:2-oxoglutarate ferredoxin oxidoreductase subunit delta